MIKEKKKWTKKQIFKEILSGIFFLGIITGGYYLVRASNHSKSEGRRIDSLFYSGCNNFVDSVRRVYEAGGRNYIHSDYEEIPREFKKDYINKNGLEGKLE